MNNIQIVPKEITKSTIIKYINVQVYSLVLFKYVKLEVLLYDDNYNIFDRKYYTLENEEYTNWMNDDTYIINYVTDKLGMSLLSTNTTQQLNEVSTQPVESSQPVESTQPVESSQFVETSQSVETSQAIETTQSVESSQPVEST